MKTGTHGHVSVPSMGNRSRQSFLPANIMQAATAARANVMPPVPVACVHCVQHVTLGAMLALVLLRLRFSPPDLQAHALPSNKCRHALIHVVTHRRPLDMEDKDGRFCLCGCNALNQTDFFFS
jgi:hypothetical protein